MGEQLLLEHTEQPDYDRPIEGAEDTLKRLDFGVTTVTAIDRNFEDQIDEPQVNPTENMVAEAPAPTPAPAYEHTLEDGRKMEARTLDEAIRLGCTALAKIRERNPEMAEKIFARSLVKRETPEQPDKQTARTEPERAENKHNTTKVETPIAKVSKQTEAAPATSPSRLSNPTHGQGITDKLIATAETIVITQTVDVDKTKNIAEPISPQPDAVRAATEITPVTDKVGMPRQLSVAESAPQIMVELPQLQRYGVEYLEEPRAVAATEAQMIAQAELAPNLGVAALYESVMEEVTHEAEASAISEQIDSDLLDRLEPLGILPHAEERSMTQLSQEEVDIVFAEIAASLAMDLTEYAPQKQPMPGEELDDTIIDFSEMPVNDEASIFDIPVQETFDHLLALSAEDAEVIEAANLTPLLPELQTGILAEAAPESSDEDIAALPFVVETIATTELTADSGIDKPAPSSMEKLLDTIAQPLAIIDASTGLDRPDLEVIKLEADRQSLEETLLKVVTLMRQPQSEVETAAPEAPLRSALSELYEAIQQGTVKETMTAEALPEITLTPEITEKLLVVLREIGYEEPAKTLIAFAEKYGTTATLQIFQQMSQLVYDMEHKELLGPQAMAILAANDTTSYQRLGSALVWLVHQLNNRPAPSQVF